MSPGGHAIDTVAATAKLRILVGVPAPTERGRVSAILRADGHHVIEVADARELRAKLEYLERTGARPDVIICAGILAEEDDPALTMRLSDAEAAPPVLLLPAGGWLSTASRAQRLGASAVLPDLSALRRVRAILQRDRPATDPPAD
jgi:AmiR/NasT family two-component response regulator